MIIKTKEFSLGAVLFHDDEGWTFEVNLGWLAVSFSVRSYADARS
jgi:hypothetical protein